MIKFLGLVMTYDPGRTQNWVAPASRAAAGVLNAATKVDVDAILTDSDQVVDDLKDRFETHSDCREQEIAASEATTFVGFYSAEARTRPARSGSSHSTGTARRAGSRRSTPWKRRWPGSTPGQRKPARGTGRGADSRPDLRIAASRGSGKLGPCPWNQ